MTLRALIPPSLKSWYALTQVRRRYPQAGLIETAWVAPSARLGVACTLGPGVYVGADVSLGDHSYANIGAILSSGTIGPYCSIGPYCDIGSPDHPLDRVSTSPALYHGGALALDVPQWNGISSPPQIGADVWIGSHAVILQGVSVGAGAVIAAGAVVTHDVEPYTIVAGVPAQPVRTRFDTDTVAKLLASRWWELDPATIRARYGDALRRGEDWRDAWS